MYGLGESGSERERQLPVQLKQRRGRCNRAEPIRQKSIIKGKKLSIAILKFSTHNEGVIGNGAIYDCVYSRFVV